MTIYNNNKFYKIILSLILVVLVSLIAFLGYGYYKSQKEINQLKDPTYLNQIQTQYSDKVLSKLGEIILLPEGTPSIINIVNVEVLKNENSTFYKNAVNGDILIIYSEMAYIFRYTEGKIINVAPVIPNASPTASPNIY